MTIVYLASYKGTHASWQGWINRAIRRVTRSPYSHSELCVGHPFAYEVPCLSSSSMDGGVRLKTMRLNPEKWDIVALPWVQPHQVFGAFNVYRGQGYDYLGCLRFLLPLLARPRANKWFCTELVAQVAGYDEPWRFCPADFHIIATERAN